MFHLRLASYYYSLILYFSPFLASLQQLLYGTTCNTDARTHTRYVVFPAGFLFPVDWSNKFSAETHLLSDLYSPIYQSASSVHRKTTHSWAKLRISYLYCVVGLRRLATLHQFPPTSNKENSEIQSYLLNRANRHSGTFFFFLSLSSLTKANTRVGKRGTKSNERRIEILHRVFRMRWSLRDT